MIYLKEPITNRVVKGEVFGEYFKDWQECSQEEIDTFELAKLRDEKIAQCKSYLSKTDWQFTAFLERQRAIPENVATNRANAVLWQNLSDEELDNININFIQNEKSI